MQDIHFQTDRLLLRRPDASDLAAYTAYCQSDRTLFVGGPFTAVQAFEKLAAMIGHWDLRGYGRLVFTDQQTGRSLGHVGALHLDLNDPLEMTWTIWAGHDEGQGYATEACAAYLRHARDVLGYSRMIARIMAQNRPSRRLAERLGGVQDVDAPAPDWFAGCVTYEFAL
jgi:[ribosomal protein S5]-alanine N-acetyltransferase